MQWRNYYLQCVRSGDEDPQTGKFPSGVRHFPRRIRSRSLILMQVSRSVISTPSSLHTRGVTARLWKTVTVDGTVQSDEVFNNSKYKSSPKIVTVGTAGASAEVVAQLQAAAAANDEGSVNPLLRLRQQRFRQHRLRHRTQMRQGRHRVRRPRLQIRMRQADTGTQPQPTDQNAAGRHRHPDTAAGRTDAVNARR